MHAECVNVNKCNVSVYVLVCVCVMTVEEI